MRVQMELTDRIGGLSAAPYDQLNLAHHVGDDPEAVQANRALVAAKLGISSTRLVVMAPVHGRDVVVFTDMAQLPDTHECGTPIAAGVDALVTTLPGVGLLTLGADCVPLALADEEAGVIGALHAGWKGVMLDVLGAMLEQMQLLGAKPERTRALMGPAICGACYEVSTQRVAQVAAVYPDAQADERHLDIRAPLLRTLRELGMTVEQDPRCTVESPECFSYRRDGRTGRAGIGIVQSH